MKFEKFKVFAIWPLVLLILLRLLWIYFPFGNVVPIGGISEIIFFLAAGYYFVKKDFDTFEAALSAGLLSVIAGFCTMILFFFGTVICGFMPPILAQLGVSHLSMNEFFDATLRSFCSGLIIGFITSFILGLIAATVTVRFSKNKENRKRSKINLLI